MRIAIVSDIHGNLTALEAVLADLKITSPDVVLHGGDLAHGGSSPAEIVDRIRDLGWQGVLGNTDEMLFDPKSLADFARRTPAMQPFLAATEEMAATAREAMENERLNWLRALPVVQKVGPMALVHAGPESTWTAPGSQASDAELEATYAPLDRQVVVYGHIHTPYVRRVGAITVINSGSASLSYDGDCRASYLLLDGALPTIRRVEYEVDREIRALADSRMPHADWLARMLRSGRSQQIKRPGY